MNIEFLKQRECQSVLNLNNLNLNEFSEDIESLFPELLEIQLSHNNIQQLDKIQMKSVEILKAGFNQLQKRINVKTPNLKYLDLQYNMIQELNIISKSIQVLNLQRNQIETVDFIKNLKDLRVLNLSQNKIKKIDFLIFNTKLEELNISNNLISNLSNAFLNTPNLQILNISNNDINDIKFIDKLPELQELYASNNNILQINVEQKNENLNILDLNNNNIEEIEIIEFKFPYLTHFYISNNQLLGEYQFNFMKLMKYIMVIEFQGNPFVTEEYENQFIIDCPWIEIVNEREVQKPAQYVNYEIQELKHQLRDNGYLDDDEQPIINSNDENSIAEERIKAIMNLYQSKEDIEQIDSIKQNIKKEQEEPMTEENFVNYITQQNEEIDKIRALYRYRMEKKQKSDLKESNINQNQDLIVEPILQKQEENNLDNQQRSKPMQVTRITKIRNSSQLLIKSIPKSTPKQNVMNEIVQLKTTMKSKDFYEQLGFTNQKMNHSSENFHNNQNSNIRSKSKQKLQSATLKLPKI